MRKVVPAQSVQILSHGRPDVPLLCRQWNALTVMRSATAFDRLSLSICLQHKMAESGLQMTVPCLFLADQAKQFIWSTTCRSLQSFRQGSRGNQHD